jgi:hypothetical protein
MNGPFLPKTARKGPFIPRLSQGGASRASVSRDAQSPTQPHPARCGYGGLRHTGKSPSSERLYANRTFLPEYVDISPEVLREKHSLARPIGATGELHRFPIPTPSNVAS